MCTYDDLFLLVFITAEFAIPAILLWLVWKVYSALYKAKMRRRKKKIQNAKLQAAKQLGPCKSQGDLVCKTKLQKQLTGTNSQASYGMQSAELADKPDIYVYHSWHESLVRNQKVTVKGAFADMAECWK